MVPLYTNNMQPTIFFQPSYVYCVSLRHPSYSPYLYGRSSSRTAQISLASSYSSLRLHFICGPFCALFLFLRCMYTRTKVGVIRQTGFILRILVTRGDDGNQQHNSPDIQAATVLGPYFPSVLFKISNKR